MNIVKFAKEILEMNEWVKELECENARLRLIEDDYNRLLDESLVHNQAMAGNIIKLMLVPGVVKACADNAETKVAE